MPGVALFAVSGAATAQTTAPSTITPQDLRPPAPPPEVPALSGDPAPLTAPAGAADLTVKLAGIVVENGLPALAGDTAAISAGLVDRTVTLAELYAGASAIEAAYARRGYVLARIVVPPQRLEDGGTFRLQLIDGVIDSIDVSGVPAAVRRPVAARLAPLIDRPQRRIGQIEQPILLAGDVPGLRLVSTLAPSTRPGAGRIVLSGRHAPLSGSVSVDNDLAPSLGRYAVTAQIALNSVLGLGEQFYGVAVSGYDVPRAFRDDAPVRVLGGGAILAIGDGRLSINPEATFSRTQAAPVANVPDTRGILRRLSVRGGYIVQKTRARTVSLSATVEHLTQSNEAIDFDLPLSVDRYTALRLGGSFLGRLSGNGVLAASMQISQGVGGLDEAELSRGAPRSRQGAGADFTRASLTAYVGRPLGRTLRLAVSARGQTSFGAPLPRAEQTGLEGRDALSAYVNGAVPVDSALVARGELSTDLLQAPVQIAPYAFGAVGTGWVSRPSALEQARITAANLGAGLRGALPGTPLRLAAEYAHGFSGVERVDHVDRVSFSTTLVF